MKDKEWETKVKPVRDTLIKLDTEKRAIEAEVRKIVYQYTSEQYPTRYEIDTFWGCSKSPFGWCCYNHFEDRGHDDCIFCHEPQERK